MLPSHLLAFLTAFMAATTVAVNSKHGNSSSGKSGKDKHKDKTLEHIKGKKDPTKPGKGKHSKGVGLGEARSSITYVDCRELGGVCT